MLGKFVTKEDCDVIPANLESVEAADKLSTLLEILYVPPTPKNIDWKDVSLHLKNKFDPFIKFIEEIGLMTQGVRSIKDHYNIN